MQAERAVQNNLAKLEILRPRIKKRYERYEQLLRDRDARNASRNASGNPNKYTPNILPSDPALSGTEALGAGDNKDLAVKLAHKEIRRRANAKTASRQAKILEKGQEKKTGGPRGTIEDGLPKNSQSFDGDTLSQQMQNLRSQVSYQANGHTQERPSFERPKLIYQYPTVPEQRSSKSNFSAVSTLKDSPPENVFTDNQAPELPSKNILVEKEIAPLRPRKEVLSKYILVEKETAPVRPRKEVLSKYDTPPRLSTASPPPHDFKPSNFTFKPSAYLENGAPLRTIFLPPDLRHQFLEIALPNTEASLETCGILCGTLISNALFISKLVIPDQESTSDTCETINEDKLFDYVDGEDLMVLGWIHTHPTQTCFMSSRDLHTHAGYQAMMPESIAIVCAPSKGEYDQSLDPDRRMSADMWQLGRLSLNRSARNEVSLELHENRAFSST